MGYNRLIFWFIPPPTTAPYTYIICLASAKLLRQREKMQALQKTFKIFRLFFWWSHPENREDTRKAWLFLKESAFATHDEKT